MAQGIVHLGAGQGGSHEQTNSDVVDFNCDDLAIIL